jgi:hypothetical protein
MFVGCGDACRLFTHNTGKFGGFWRLRWVFCRAFPQESRGLSMSDILRGASNRIIENYARG